MIRKYCRNCNKETLQNPLKKQTNKDQEYRCVECGHPLRLGGNAKNYAVKHGGKIKCYGPGQPIN